MKEGADVIVLGQIGQELGILGLHGLDLLGKGDARRVHYGYIGSKDLLELNEPILFVDLVGDVEIGVTLALALALAHLLDYRTSCLDP